MSTRKSPRQHSTSQDKGKDKEAPSSSRKHKSRKIDDTSSPTSRSPSPPRTTEDRDDIELDDIFRDENGGETAPNCVSEEDTYDEGTETGMLLP